jgi:hypothetical protein
VYTKGVVDVAKTVRIGKIESFALELEKQISHIDKTIEALQISRKDTQGEISGFLGMQRNILHNMLFDYKKHFGFNPSISITLQGDGDKTKPGVYVKVTD